MQIVIREARPDDAPFLIESNIRLASETEQLQLNRSCVTAGVKALLGDAAKGTYYIAEAGGVVAGQLLITYEWSDWRNGTFWWIQSVYVSAAQRGRGVFRALFQHVHDLATSRPDVCGLRLYVDAQNAAARGVYSRLGLQQTNYEMLELDLVLGHSQRVPGEKPNSSPHSLPSDGRGME